MYDDGGAHDSTHDREMMALATNFIVLAKLLHHLHIVRVEI